MVQGVPSIYPKVAAIANQQDRTQGGDRSEPGDWLSGKAIAQPYVRESSKVPVLPSN